MKKQLMKFFIALLLLGVYPCFGQETSFQSFLTKFKQLEFPFIVSDEPLKNNKDIFTKGFRKEEFMKFLNGIKEPYKKDSYFYFGGKVQYKDFSLLTYRITDFDDAPDLDVIRINLVTFDKKGTMIAKMMIGGQNIENLINCKLNKDLTFTVTTLNSSNKILQSKNYFIDTAGNIKPSK